MWLTKWNYNRGTPSKYVDVHQYRKSWRVVSAEQIITQTNKKLKTKGIHRAEILILLILADCGPLKATQIKRATNCRWQYVEDSLNKIIEQQLAAIVPDLPGQVHTITPAGKAYLNTFERFAVTWRKPTRITQFKR